MPLNHFHETDAARDVLAERERQISAEFWTPFHDDAHSTGDLARAAAAYAISAATPGGVPALSDSMFGCRILPTIQSHNCLWPWQIKWWKPKDPRRSQRSRVMLNAHHPDDTCNSYQWGQRLAGAIELALCAVAQVRQISAAEACVIAEAIIENGAGEDAHRDADALYAGALEGSPRYALAHGDLIKQRSAQIGRAA